MRIIISREIQMGIRELVIEGPGAENTLFYRFQEVSLNRALLSLPILLSFVVNCTIPLLHLFVSQIEPGVPVDRGSGMSSSPHIVSA
jgi:hypothetical protein